MVATLPCVQDVFCSLIWWAQLWLECVCVCVRNSQPRCGQGALRRGLLWRRPGTTLRTHSVDRCAWAGRLRCSANTRWRCGNTEAPCHPGGCSTWRTDGETRSQHWGEDRLPLCWRDLVMCSCGTGGQAFIFQVEKIQDELYDKQSVSNSLEQARGTFKHIGCVTVFE